MGTDEQVCAVDAKLSVQKDMSPWAKIIQAWQSQVITGGW